MTVPLLQVRDAVKTYRQGGGEVRAVDGVSFSIARGAAFGLVGESGSGKSTLGRCVLRLEQLSSGAVTFDGADLQDRSASQMRRLRSRMQIVFQDPHSSLNRRMTVAEIIAAPLRAHGQLSRSARSARVAELLDLAQLAGGLAARLPRELSGGQAQRVAIARALALSPDLIVLDEAVSALDVSVRGQILNLLKELQRDLSLTYLFISHDLSVVRYVCDDIAVMYRGRLVETGSREGLFGEPQHPYTDLLLQAVPVVDPIQQRLRMREAAVVEDDTETMPPGGCRFQPRCTLPTRDQRCLSQDPVLMPAGRVGSMAACHHPGRAHD